ncbi:LacI family transcriptional regulator [Streptomyces sp. DvalAA-14]|uniref:LacI family DNA-binding transcriptional regulator n=1 Tax=unclassified Streptomyces TaxID=2593676 RepID=UPI00081B66C1|nr:MULTISPECIES: LacI family DNA-binding transcriptional regulator [unclassified Streptomyces]MYS20998.1 substrate-binding domain-containing protein [Streptomyces sp. SID4948]SCD81664.1 LacI family transcriptional regulator [Streptomyces sp. DvalAA-14]
MVDVAREAGVALRTVSRVVNGDATVGDGLAERIRQAIDRLGYQPDERARQLRSGRTGTIGAAVRHIADAHPVLRAVDESARAVGLTVVAMSTEDDEVRERDAVMSMCRRRMDGIIIEPIADGHQYLQAEIDSGLAVVAFDRPATGVAVDTVLSDNRGGIQQAFTHLVAQGHRRIGYIGDDERIYTGRERAAAFRDALSGIGEPLDGMVHPGPIEPGRIAAALASLRGRAEPVTAIVTGNFNTTVALIRALGPDFGSTALVGFDDFGLADLLRPGLTVVAQGDVEIGRTAIELFRSRLADPGRAVRTVTVPTTLIARGTGEIAP